MTPGSIMATRFSTSTLMNAGHAGQGEDKSSVFGYRASAESCSGAARYDRNIVLRRHSDAARDFISAVGKGDDGRERTVNRTVVFKDNQVFGFVEHILSTDDGLKLFDYRFEVHDFALVPEANHS